MSFDVAGEAYDRLVGRWSRPLAPRFLDFARVGGAPVLDVGAGPGALTEVLAARLGPASVAAVEPSPPFAAACRARVPGVDVRAGGAESLPFPDGTFAAALAQLVFSFVPDAPRATSEMARVVRPGGVVAACTWAWDGFPLAQAFWQAALRFDPAAPDDAGLPIRRPGQLAALWKGAGLADVAEDALDVTVSYEHFDDFWGPFAGGAGPPGGYLVRQPEPRRAAIRDSVRDILGNPAGAFTLRSRALAVRGVRP
jgi:SAM-dependent methyltransferase